MASPAHLRSIGDGEREVFDPEAGANAYLTLTWSLSGELTRIDKKIGEFTYRKSLTWVGGYPVLISDWVKLP